LDWGHRTAADPQVGTASKKALVYGKDVSSA
jgi:hypothetical protein